MKINHTNPHNTQINRFDKELKAILLHDLARFRQENGRFLKNAEENKQSNGSAERLVA